MKSGERIYRFVGEDSCNEVGEKTDEVTDGRRNENLHRIIGMEFSVYEIKERMTLIDAKKRC